MIGRPKDFLSDVSSNCISLYPGSSDCVELGKRACNKLENCWGFGVHTEWGVQIYDAKASNSRVCKGSHGLKQNDDWTTYIKEIGNLI